MVHFRYPLPDLAPRVAVCGVPGATGLIYEAETVAAPVDLLLRLGVPGWEPFYPVVAFTGRKHGFLSDADRDEIWRIWGVPVYEQLLSDDYGLIAEECDAHEGLHLCEGAVVDRGQVYFRGVPTGIEAIELSGACGCRHTAARIAWMRAVKGLSRVA
jgi:hypothetical protein